MLKLWVRKYLQFYAEFFVYLNLCYITESIAQDHFDIALLLIDSHCDVCQTDRLQQAPIHSAVRKGRYLYMSQDPAEGTSWHVRTAKIQVSLSIRTD